MANDSGEPLDDGDIEVAEEELASSVGLDVPHF
jgi:hypothetical protein